MDNCSINFSTPMSTELAILKLSVPLEQFEEERR